MFPKSYADTVQRLRVPAGLVLLAAFVWFAHPSSGSLALGVPLSILGLAIRGWAAGYLAKNETLAVSGPYAYCRNPLYLGSLIVACGVTVAARSASLALLLGVIFFFVYLPVMELEGQHLRKLFPGYDEYARRVPLLIPRGGNAARNGRFRPDLYMKNQEYKALLGYLVGLALLVWRSGVSGS